MKKVIVSGCSFTFEDWNWPKFLIKHLKIRKENLNNVGMASQGNGLISKKLIYAVNKELETTKPEDILVGVMLSGVDRFDFHSENNYSSDNWGNNGHVSHIDNPTKVAVEKKWYFINPGWDGLENPHPLMKSHYEYFHSDIGMLINTIHSILLVQWYLKEKGIKYFMTTFMDIFNRYPKNILESEDVSYLLELIDFNNFLNVDGCYEHVSKNFPSGMPNSENPGIHPLESGHKYFTDTVIIPHLNKMGIKSNSDRDLI